MLINLFPNNLCSLRQANSLFLVTLLARSKDSFAYFFPNVRRISLPFLCSANSAIRFKIFDFSLELCTFLTSSVGVPYSFKRLQYIALISLSCNTGFISECLCVSLKVFMHQNKSFFVFAIIQNAILFREE